MHDTFFPSLTSAPLTYLHYYLISHAISGYCFLYPLFPIHILPSPVWAQLETIHAVVPRAHETLSNIATAGLALSKRLPLANVHRNMVVGSEEGGEGGWSGESGGGVGSVGGLTSRVESRSRSASKSRSVSRSRSRSVSRGSSRSSSPHRGRGSTTESTGTRDTTHPATPDRTTPTPTTATNPSTPLNPTALTPAQLDLLDATVALRLHRLTTAFATVKDLLTHDPATVARLADALTALQALPVDALGAQERAQGLLRQLETKVRDGERGVVVNLRVGGSLALGSWGQICV